MANGRRDAAKEAYWREVLVRQASSGLSVREFCQRENLSEPSLHAWRRTIAERDNPLAQREGVASPQARQPPFVPAKLSNEQTPIAITLSSGCVLRFSNTEQLADLVLGRGGTGERCCSVCHWLRQCYYATCRL